MATLLPAALLLAWLLLTGGGRDLVLARLAAALPADALSWQQAEGRLAGPLILHGVRYRQADGLEVRATRLELEPALWPALGGRLRLDRLAVRDLRLRLPPADDEPFQPPRWPESLPRIPLPFVLAVGELSVDRLAIEDDAAEGEDDARFEASDIEAREVVLRDDGLSLASLRAFLPQAELELAGDYLPARHFRTDLRGRLRSPTAEDGAGPDLQLIAKGDLDALQLDLTGTTPERLQAHLDLREGGGTPAWTLSLHSDGLPPAWLGGEPDASAWRGRLQAEGLGGEARVEGALANDELRVVIAPSQLALVDDRLMLRPLNLELPQGALRLTGQVQYGDDTPAFDLQLASDALTLAPQSADEGGVPVLASGQVRVQGVPQAWRLRGEASFERGSESARLRLAGEGDGEALQLRELAASMPTGELAGSGRVAWSPRPAFAADLRLDGFDPGYFLPDYPGALTGQLQASAKQDEAGSWRGEGRLERLGGRLRGLAVAGQAQLDWRDDRGRLAADLRLGSSHVQVAGQIGARYDLRIEAEPLTLADALPPGSGRIEGWLRLLGPAEALDIEADLVGHDLRLDDQQIGALRLHGRLPATGDGELVLAGEELRLGGLGFEALAVRALGSRARAELQGNLAWPQGHLEVGGELGQAHGLWQGQLATLRLVAQDSPELQLQAAAAFRFGADITEFDRACLVSTRVEGRLCAEAGGGEARLQAEALPLSLLQPWLPQDEGVPMHLAGSVDGEALLRQGRDGFWRGQGQLRSGEGALRLDEQSDRVVFGYSALSLDWTLDGDALQATLSAGLADEGKVTARLAAGLADTAALDGDLALDVRNLTWLELFSEDLASPRGRLHGRMQLTGTRGEPQLSGQARLGAFEAELPALGLQLREGEFTLDGQADGSTRLSGQLRSGEGLLQVEGSLNLRDDTAPLRVALVGSGVSLANTAEFQAVADPDLQLQLAGGVLEVRGRVNVEQARFDLEALDTGVSASEDVVVLDPLDPPKPRQLPLDLDVSVALGEDVRLQGFGLDGKVGGKLRVRQRPGRPARASGGLEVSGRYRAYGQALEVERARLGFADSPVDNPSLDIRAGRDFDQVSVRVRVTGTARQPQLRIESDPAMDTSEALSWLVFGRPLRSAKGNEAEQLSAAAMALGAGGNMVAQQIGARLGLDEAGIAESRNLGGAALTVGKHLSPRLFISYGVALVGTGQVVTLKYLLTRGFDISIESGNESAASLNWRMER
ncbi:translocation/assembly module TamB domain-containing protein [Arenimonas fontis]|uniref:Translocation and assembly module TamB C-terminal domain-containing protein n=1 Tax=Arenimonas fontis TaxID=2608255 RepID=A0A5B2Z8Q1_9GAMM|nr:translocation/assembly module TamB domain-containing protein [Arenimonas fontis]KAA2284277.1 hypothetical protein F0415_10305 [Arenimonas fontis]